ncbi:Translation initiation factor eIF-2B subunit delta [Chionoecetes opilio]|uniref:Translation initiation factor eIF2B subunit delta n=1 Tax=Chionoecetes opilio TaxID=41210 RepID=A0A8J4XX67_CHIOP|nr:Translation initiation factor eIF-2B subunit delta [Chionoecetes opilio]
MAPPDTPKRRGRKRSKRRTSSSGPRHTSLSEDARPSTLPGSPAAGKKGPGKGGSKGQANTVVPQQTCTTATMPQKENKLGDLCSLLDNIILQHGNKDTTSPVRKPAGAEGATAAAPPGAGRPPQPALPSTSTGASSSLPPAPEAKVDLSKEELEKERKARKEAKKAKKKGPGKENVEERKETHNSVQPPQRDAAAITAQTPVTSSRAAEAVTSVPVVDSRPGQESSGQLGPSGQDDVAGKSKAGQRKERREKQEAQRLAKLALKAQTEEPKQKAKDKQVVAGKGKAASKAVTGGEGARKGRVRRASSKVSRERKVPLLGHLTPYSPSPPPHEVNSDSVHPAVLSLGLKMKYGVVEGSTARVVSMLAAFKRFISDYRTPDSCDLSRDMADKLKPNVDFLHACRPHAIAMDNAIRSVKHKINSIDPATPEAQAKDELRGDIDVYVEENIVLASSTIASHATSLIHNDVLLTFGYSALVCDVVEAVVKAGGKVSVVVADYSQPPSGATMVQCLERLGVTTYYRLVTDLSHIMSKVTKVVVEAEAVMMNGAVQAMCGTACLALAAATHHKPFIVLCQTYKFCNMDLTDSLVVNELGDANSMVSCASQNHCGVLADWRDTQNLNVVRLVYDVTPASLVTVLVTEQSVLPTSAVPVIIHRKYADILGQD